jgi:GNAT superfamily N-acetyltransferase
LDDQGDFELRLIEPDDRLKGLSSGDPKFTPLKTFIEKHAKGYHQQSLARTYGLFKTVQVPAKKAGVDPTEKTDIVGYVTLVCGEIDANGAGQVADGYTYSHFPAMKIARLMIDSRLRKKKWGEQLVDFAVGTAKDIICPAVGCRFVVVDAKKESIGFYERCGFTLLDTDENRDRESPVMFLDLHKVALQAALQPA